jgi:hypothetical protein
MNEQIKQLYVEATGKDWAYDFDPQVAEKFAELIVKECADLCDRFQARDVGMQPAECAGAIRKMFGVKE